jgi:TDG/mug DNA glycosylase family protein
MRQSARPFRPTREQLASAAGKTVPDLLTADLRVLFVGINPGLYSAAVRHHFGRPGNRFWPLLHAAGFTPRRLSPFEERELLSFGCGITNVAARATARAEELTETELQRGAAILKRKVRRWQPRTVAFLGITAYRTGFSRPTAAAGPQSEDLAGAAVWVLPNPSGLNAHYPMKALTEWFSRLREATTESPARAGPLR